MKFIDAQENRPDEDWKHHISGIVSAAKTEECLLLSSPSIYGDGRG